MNQESDWSFKCCESYSRSSQLNEKCSIAVSSQVYKKLGQTHLALMNFSWAMDLDPKGANNQIKEAIDKRYLPDDEEPITQEEHISEYCA